MQKVDRLKDLLSEFNVKNESISYHSDPFKESYDIERGRGITISKIESLRREIASCLGLSEKVIVIEPNPSRSPRCVSVVHYFPTRKIVRLNQLLSEQFFDEELPIVLGVDVKGAIQRFDLAKCPHLLVAGQTGSGKSVFLRGIIHSLLFCVDNKFIDPIRIAIVDPKREFSAYSNLKSLLHIGVAEKREPFGYFPNVKNVDQLFDNLLNRANMRQQFFGEHGLSSIDQYKSQGGRAMPRIVVVIDELADLLEGNANAKSLLDSLARKARSAGIHLVAAVQRPSADVLSGSIKNNFPTRAAFRVGSRFDSEVVLERGDASKLIGNGDFIFQHSQIVQRLQAGYIDNIDIGEFVRQFS